MSALSSPFSPALEGKASSSSADPSPSTSRSPNSLSSSSDLSPWRVVTSVSFPASWNLPPGSRPLGQPRSPRPCPGSPRSLSHAGVPVPLPAGAQCSPLGTDAGRWAAPLVVPHWGCPVSGLPALASPYWAATLSGPRGPLRGCGPSSSAAPPHLLSRTVCLCMNL